MPPFSRRRFLEGLVVSSAAAASATAESVAVPRPVKSKSETRSEADGAVDFRYGPRLSQATICFPDDPKKTLVGQLGDLRYGFAKGLLVGMEDFATVYSFSLAGMQDERVVRQWVEAPHIPIVHTLIERPTATLELTAFATRHGNEGRVDNVLLSIVAKKGTVAAIPRIHVRTCEQLKQSSGPPTIVVRESNSNSPFLLACKLGAAVLDFATWWEEAGYTLYLPHGEAVHDKPLQYFIRFPQEGQGVEILQDMLQHPDELAEEAREYWKNWKPFGNTSWRLPGKEGEFLVACARNIQQARETKDGRLVFQVGPTVYRGLWIVDGNFLLEAARYFGYDKEADDGLLAEWAKQLPSGQVVAGGGGEHWKDTAIAMFTLVRQCELKQDWRFFKELEPNVLRAIQFLVQQRDSARTGNSTNGRYGLLGVCPSIQA